jgi:hypothetical protein
VEAIRRKVVRA